MEKNKNLGFWEKKQIIDLRERKSRLGKLFEELKNEVIKASSSINPKEMYSIHRLADVLKKKLGKNKKEEDIFVVLAELIREICSMSGIEIGVYVSILSNGGISIAINSFDFSRAPDS